MANKIIIVDDEDSIRGMLKTLFDREGFDVTCAETGEEGLRLAKQDFYQIHIIDMNLPGMDGLELFRRLKNDRPVAFYFAITGYTSIFSLVKCRKAGFDNYFSKPFDLKLLVKSVKNACENLERWRVSQEHLKKVLTKPGKKTKV